MSNILAAFTGLSLIMYTKIEYLGEYFTRENSSFLMERHPSYNTYFGALSQHLSLTSKMVRGRINSLNNMTQVIGIVRFTPENSTVAFPRPFPSATRAA